MQKKICSNKSICPYILHFEHIGLPTTYTAISQSNSYTKTFLSTKSIFQSVIIWVSVILSMTITVTMTVTMTMTVTCDNYWNSNYDIYEGDMTDRQRVTVESLCKPLQCLFGIWVTFSWNSIDRAFICFPTKTCLSHTIGGKYCWCVKILIF